MEQNQAKLWIIKYWNKLQQNKSKIDFGGGLKLIPIWKTFESGANQIWRKYCGEK
jgi:hypothetical protein